VPVTTVDWFTPAGVGTVTESPLHVVAMQCWSVTNSPDWLHLYVTVPVYPAEHLNAIVDPMAACVLIPTTPANVVCFGAGTMLGLPSQVTGVHASNVVNTPVAEQVYVTPLPAIAVDENPAEQPKINVEPTAWPACRDAVPFTPDERALFGVGKANEYELPSHVTTPQLWVVANRPDDKHVYVTEFPL
jgi:hypothetical protein